jgi:uncharacterized OsmC-like protein
VVGSVIKDGNVLVVDSIHVTYHLKGVESEEDRATAERVLGFHADKCPLARTVRDVVAITTQLEFVT